jgi:excisionase family DNA binding protein
MADDVVRGEEPAIEENATNKKTQDAAVHTDVKELPLFLTADEAASLLRTSRAAIYAMAERGRLAGVTRVGRRLLVSRNALLRSLSEGRAQSPRGTRR